MVFLGFPVNLITTSNSVTMSKLGAVFCIALFVTSGNAFSRTINLRNLGEHVQQAINTGMSKLVQEYKDSLLHVASEAKDLANRATSLTSSISEHLAAVAEDLSNKLKLEVGKAEEVGVDVDDCSPPHDTETLGELAKAVVNTSSVCIYNDIDKALRNLDEIRNISIDALDKVDNARKESKRCHDDEKTTAAAVSCSASYMTDAAFVALPSAIELTTKWGQLKVTMLFFERRVYDCTQSDLATLDLEVNRIRTKTTECIQNKIQQAQAATPESH